MQVSAVVVTFNKLDLLKECLEALFNQSYSLSHIIVVDNASKSPTKKYLNNLSNQGKIDYVQLEKNIGGAGGFNAGLKTFIQQTDDKYVWIMDDDTIPNQDALEKMINVAPEIPNLGFLCSNVRWTDGSPSAMNMPHPTKVWPELAEQHLVQVDFASFVSVLVTRQAILTVGYPISDFFIWGDDVEFTERISAKFLGYFVGDSIVIHKMAENKSVNIALETNPNRVKRYFYAFRNRHVPARSKGFEARIFEVLFVLNTVRRILSYHTGHKGLKLRTLIKGTVAGFFFHPKIETAESSDHHQKL